MPSPSAGRADVMEVLGRTIARVTATAGNYRRRVSGAETEEMERIYEQDAGRCFADAALLRELADALEEWAEMDWGCEIADGFPPAPRGKCKCPVCRLARLLSPEEPTPLSDAGSDLTTRRAEFVYLAARLAAIAANAPIIPEPWAEREPAFRDQFLEVIERQCGPDRSGSPEELHGSWVQAYIEMGWRYGEIRDPAAKIHPDLVPYAKLGQLERDKDAVFVELCEIARKWIYDEEPLT